MFGSNEWRKVGREKKKRKKNKDGWKYLSVGTRLLMSTRWRRPIERYHDNDYIQIEKKTREKKNGWMNERNKTAGKRAQRPFFFLLTHPSQAVPRNRFVVIVFVIVWLFSDKDLRLSPLMDIIIFRFSFYSNLKMNEIW